MIQCENCGHENPDDYVVCDVCNFALINPQEEWYEVIFNKEKDVEAAIIVEDDLDEDSLSWESIPFTGTLILEVTDCDKRFDLSLTQSDGLIIGRKDPDANETPAVDLSDCDALNKGVSRQHAIIKAGTDSKVMIVDNNSSNGTYLNGLRLVAHQPEALRHSDILQIGELVIHVLFAAANEADTSRAD